MRDFDYENKDVCAKEDNAQNAKNDEKYFTEKEMEEIVKKRVKEQVDKKLKQRKYEIKQIQGWIKENKRYILKNRKKLALSFAMLASSIVLFFVGVLGFGHLMIGNASKEGKNMDAAEEAMRKHPAYVQVYESDREYYLEKYKNKEMDGDKIRQEMDKLESMQNVREVVNIYDPEGYKILDKQYEDACGKCLGSVFGGLIGTVGSGVGFGFAAHAARKKFSRNLNNVRWGKSKKKENEKDLEELQNS